MAENRKNLEGLLNERVKELRCLFEVSKLCQDLDRPKESILNDISALIPEGWQFPDRLEVYLKIDDYAYGEFDSQSVFLETIIKVHDVDRGLIRVTYPDVDQELFSFLEEESPLLQQIGLETAFYIERLEQREKENKIEEVLRGNDRLNILGELTAGIAHELNTPLGNILGYAELLQKSEVDEFKKRDIQKIISSAKNAREIVKRLMYFSCEMPQQFSMSKMNDLIHENLGFLQKQLLEGQIKIKLELDENIPLIRLDALQFSQVLFNLILNAINAMSIGGEITISTTYSKSNVELIIKDNGKGISKENQLLIFQPFFTTKAVGEGTGLGLSVVHGIVKGHGGEIYVASEVGVGTEFILRFPLN